MDSKANKDMDDLSNTGKHAVIALGRQFTIVEVTVAEGDAEIADIYSLGLTDSTSIKIGFFHVCLKTSSNGYSYMNFLTNVIPQSVCLEMNNDFTTEGSVCLPFKNSITIGFPIINAGVASGTKVEFIGCI